MARQPDVKRITPALKDASVEEILTDLFVAPRAAVRKWAERTGQTTQAKTAYLGQHLASVLTGIPGEGTAARGNDLSDGSEVKTCSRADQLGSCKECKAPVPSWRHECGTCGCTDIRRKTDSHWLMSIRSDEELTQLLSDPRILFILFDRTHNQDDIRARAWEVWPADPSHKYFEDFARNYYEENFKKKTSAAPCNLHPLKFDFLMMNPVLTLDAQLRNVDEQNASVHIDYFFPRDADRDAAPVEAMPPAVCSDAELQKLLTVPDELQPGLKPNKTEDDLRDLAAGPLQGLARRASDVLDGIPPPARRMISMREKRIVVQGTPYRRRETRS